MALNNPYALSFDGVDDRIDRAISRTNIQSHTIEFWAKPRKVSALETFLCLGDGSSKPPVLIRTNNYKIEYYLGSASSTVFKSNSSLMVDSLIHVACVYNLSNLSIYINGKLDASISYNANIVSFINVSIGNWERTSQYYNGSMDEVRLWNYARSQEQINETMNKKLKGDEAGLILYYRFDEGTGSIAHDSSSSGLDGTISGATWVPGEVDLSDLTPPGQNLLSAYLAGGAYLLSSSIIGKGLSSNLFAGAEMSVGSFARTRGLSAKLKAQATTTSKLTLLASLNANLEGLATIRAGILKLIIPPGTYEITADDYFRKEQPAKSDELVNSIKVYVNPLMPTGAPVEVYKSPLIKIPAGQSVITTIQYNEPPVLEAVATLDSPPDVSITNAVYYAWGAEITITNSGAVDADATLLISGKPLKVLGKQLISVKDEKSIRDNGLLEFEFRDNPLVQTTEMAEKIANNLISFSIPRRDVRVEWRGNPALILADKINVPEYQKGLIDKRGLFYIIKQNIRYDGGLRTTTEGRKIK